MWLQRINPQLNLIWRGLWPVNNVEAARRIYDHELVLFNQGECRVRVERHEFHCGPGTFMIIPPNRVHVTTSISKEPVYRTCFHFDWVYSPRAERLPICVFLPGRLESSGVRAAPRWVEKALCHGKVVAPIPAQQLSDGIFTRWPSGDRATRGTCRALLLELLVRLLSPAAQRSTRDRQSELAERAKRLLDEQYSNNQSIQELLEKLDMSYAHLCRIFTRHYGISPLAYINAGRLERARNLLTEGQSSVKEVAHRVGFDDAAYFSRLFRRAHGVPPSELNRERRPTPAI
jgi:AraC family transcriptional regulator of arabinose operon